MTTTSTAFPRRIRRAPSVRIVLQEEERLRLLAIYEACVACELASIVAAEHLAQLGVSCSHLLACASICGETAARLAALQVPDAAEVRDVLLDCASACARARATCEAVHDDALAHRCMTECARCEARCADVTGRAELAA
jgi:hypothetical protein